MGRLGVVTRLKKSPVTETALISRSSSPPLAIVKVFVESSFVFTVPKFQLEGVELIEGDDNVLAEPVAAIVRSPSGSFVTIVTVPL
jgi:hypothetical protein